MQIIPTDVFGSNGNLIHECFLNINHQSWGYYKIVIEDLFKFRIIEPKLARTHDTDIILISEEEEWYISKKIAKKTYAYNEKGWVESITTSSNDAQPLEIIQYTYDDRGNVQTAKKLIDGVAVEEYEVIYQNGALVKAILHQDLMSTAITIHKYEYTFR